MNPQELNGTWLKRKIRRKVWKNLPMWQKALIIATAGIAVDAVVFDGKILLRKIGRITGSPKK